MSSAYDYLQPHPYFADLATPALERIARQAVVSDLSRGEIIAVEGEPCRAVYFVMQGRIHATKMSPEGREQVVNELTAGQAFYLVPAMDEGPLPATAQAATRARVLSFPRDRFVQMLDEHPHLCRRVLTDFARRLRRLGNLVEDLSLRSVAQRLARLLLRRAQGPQQGRRLTQREMAAHLGTVREVVARTLSSFEDEGWIDVQRGRIEVLDPEALRDLADL